MKALRPSLRPSGSGIIASVCARPLGSEGEARAAEEPRPPIVALVCSAGGLQALTAVLGGLPADFGAAVVVAQHQQPTHPSHLSELLARRCLLPVVPAEPGRPLRPGVVVVVPAGTHALVTLDGRLALIASDGPPPYRRSADLLFTSLALVAAGRTIGVILSGGGSDGATGATALHDFGGTVILSDRASSEHFSMPGAAIGRDEVVDHVVPLGDIARLLVTLLAEVTPAPSAAGGAS
jgi:two-component system chemotaxis response regulator CheB